MFKITLLSGPFAGRAREFQGLRVLDPQTGQPGEPVSPADLFASLVRHGWRWEADYSQATLEEALVWLRAELAARAVRALERGLPVKFLGREYRAEPGQPESVLEAAQRLEDAIVASGRLVTIEADDDDGVVISVKGWEQ